MRDDGARARGLPEVLVVVLVGDTVDGQFFFSVSIFEFCKRGKKNVKAECVNSDQENGSFGSVLIWCLGLVVSACAYIE